MAKKTFTYRGKTLEELNRLSLNELAILLPSRQRRKIKRGFSEAEKKLVEKMKKKDNVKTQLRDMIVLPSMIGKTVKVHSGNAYIQVLIQDEMLGCRIGELILSRKRVQHSNPGVGSTKAAAPVK
ncbi:MAG: 30S ribosomal protein S19 [Candidatus Woesearchaeota archaeon]|jgi:small subunit ribosomal protein S19